MKPKGLVAAASITSQTFTPNFSHIIAVSFASPIFTDLKVFSKSLTISAASGDETITISFAIEL